MTFMAFRLFQLLFHVNHSLPSEKRDKWRPGKGSAGTRDKQAKKRDVPAKTGRLATLVNT